MSTNGGFTPEQDNDKTTTRQRQDKCWTCAFLWYLSHQVCFTPEQDNDKTTTRQMLNLCIPMIPFTPGLFHTRARQRQDNDKTNVEPVHSYDAFHTRFVSCQSKTTTRQRQDKCWTCAFLWYLSHQICRTWCERHNRNAQVQHLSCCLVVVLLWCENTITVTTLVTAGIECLERGVVFWYYLGITLSVTV